MCIASLSQSDALMIAAASSDMTATQLPGLGNAAVLLSGNSDGKDVAILVVWRGTEGYSLIGSAIY